MDSRLIRWIQNGLVVFLFVMAAVTVIFTDDPGTLAPLLTLIGGLVILVPLLKLDKLELMQLAPIVGILIVSAGSYFWLSEATGGKAGFTLATVFLSAVAVIVFCLVVAGYIYVLKKADALQDPDEMIRASRIRKVKRTLKDIVDETRSAGFGTYTRYDHDIHGLFRAIWVMLNRPHLTTYNWNEHKNLIENYAVAKLERTAEIAVDKHPYQCKYGEIADGLAYDILRGLQPVHIIRCFDPLPQVCPECKEAKPGHKANCMAAICWRCKHPTPPIEREGKNAAIITPQCWNPLLCSPRGEQPNPTLQPVRRIPLAFSMPINDSHEINLGPKWPRNRRDLDELLELLKQEEDLTTQPLSETR